jgi:hypothetical protein
VRWKRIKEKEKGKKKKIVAKYFALYFIGSPPSKSFLKRKCFKKRVKV